MLFLGGLTGLTGFLITLRSVNVQELEEEEKQ